MVTQSLDTHPKAEEVQVSLIRQASTAQRASRMRSLSGTVIQLSRRAILRAHPGLSEHELNLMVVAYHYGTDLADRLQEYLNGRIP